jgi:hypothetical protein
MYGSTQRPQSTNAARPSQTPGVHWPNPTVTETPSPTTQRLVALHGLIALVAVACIDGDLLADEARGIAHRLHLLDALVALMLIDTDLPRGRTEIAAHRPVVVARFPAERRGLGLGHHPALFGRVPGGDAGGAHRGIAGNRPGTTDQRIVGAIDRERRSHRRIAGHEIDGVTLLPPVGIHLRSLAGAVDDLGRTRPRQLTLPGLEHLRLGGALSEPRHGRGACAVAYSLEGAVDRAGAQRFALGKRAARSIPLRPGTACQEQSEEQPAPLAHRCGPESREA